jgi:very-short-patch-repair endonuclease
MSAGDEPRVWAKRDRSIVSPQRRLARGMRAAQTEAERKLWWHLRHRVPTPGSHFRRQVRIGRYIADFACHANRIVIEVDGGQHSVRLAADEVRTKALEANGYRVLRYWNNDVLSNINSVLEDIFSAITTTPTPNPSPQGGGEHTERVANSAASQTRSPD